LLLLCLLVEGFRASAQAQNAVAPAAVDPNGDDEVIYLDPEGFIRVYDPFGAPKITWISPEGGWEAAALGDFTGDGDEEIVAVGGEGPGGRLVIYDPVIASGPVDAGQQFNGIPWRQLFAVNLGATPRLVATGEFDASVAGREIVYTTDVPADSDGDPRSALTILTQNVTPPDGTAWRTLAGAITGQAWSDISTGDLALSGSDHIALIDEDRGVLAVFRLQGGGLERYYISSSDSREWSSSAIGQVDPATVEPELVLVRRADRPLASLVVWRYLPPGKFEDVYLRDFNPAPRVVFLADVNATAEAEIFMLRNVVRTAGCPPPYGTPPFQLIMRNRGPDRPTNFEVCLDQANTFRYGAGGDLNGDGKDEAIVISATQLRTFYNVDTTFTVTNEPVSSRASMVAAGNLDKAGAIKPNTLAASRSSLSFEVPAGEQSRIQTIELTNIAPSGEPIPLLVHIAPQVDYIRWSLSSATTPATLSVFVDASALLPDIVYAAQLVIEADGVSVTNTPYTIPVLTNVQTGVIVRPAAVTVVQTPCNAEDEEARLQLDLRVLGTAGVPFIAVVAAGPGLAAAQGLAAATAEPSLVQGAEPLGAAGMAAIDWEVNDVPWIVSAQSPTTSVPSTITLIIAPSRAGAFNQAHVTVTGAGGAYIRTAEIAFVCTDFPVFLPIVQRLAWPR
jgi:hypothetical protein